MTALDTIKQAVLGVPFDPGKQPSRQGVVKAFSEMQTQLEAAQAGAFVRSTRTALNAFTAAPASAMAWVVNDLTPSNNGIYENTGSAMAAIWTRRTDIPQFIVTAMNTGEGTANAIKATTDRAIPVQDGRCLILVPIVANNTISPPTVQFNNGTIYPIVSNNGNDVLVNGLIADMVIAGYISAGKFRLINDQVSAAYVAEIEALINGVEETIQNGIDTITDLVNDAVSATNVPIFSSRNAVQSETIPVGLKSIRTNGYANAGDFGKGLYNRVASQPTHTGKVRSNDRFMPDGSTDATNGGWWELIEDKPSVLQFGIPDKTGVASASSVFEDAVIYAKAKGIREVFVPAGKYNLNDANYTIHYVLWRGDGELIGYRIPITKPGQLNTFRMPPGIIPELHLKRLLASDRPVIVIMGDSLTGSDVVSPLNVDDSLTNKIRLFIKYNFPEKKPTIYVRSLGGSRFADWADVWPGAKPSWYTDPDRKSIEYIRDLNPDFVVVNCGVNDGYLWDVGNFAPRFPLSIFDSLRGFQNEPDILLCSNIVPSKATNNTDFNTEYAQEGRDAIAGWTRSVTEVSNHYAFADFNRWMNVVRDGRDVIDNSFDEISAIVSTQTIPFIPNVPTHDWIITAEFTSITSDFWLKDGVHPIEIRFSNMPANLAFLDAIDGYLRIRIFSATGALSYQKKTAVLAPTTGTDVKIIISRQGSNFFLSVNDNVIFDDVQLSYGGLYSPLFVYEGNPTGMTGKFTFMPGKPMVYPPQILDKEIFLDDDGPLLGANPWNHPTGYGSDVVYEPIVTSNGRGIILSPETKALTDLRTRDGVLFDFVTQTYAMRSRFELVKNKTGPVSDLVLDTAGGSLSYASHPVTGECIGLSVATGSAGAHILLSNIPFNASEGTMLVEGYAVSDSDPGYLAVIARDANFGPRIECIATQDGNATFNVIDDSEALGAAAAFVGETIGKFARFVISWKTNDITMSLNGWRYAQDDVANIPTALTRIKLGHASGTSQCSIVIRRLFISPYALGPGEAMSRGF